MRTEKVDCASLFFEAVSVWLANAKMRRCEGGERKVIVGDLVQPEYQAAVEILFYPSKLKLLRPTVFCNEPWVRREIDWHCIPYRKACSSWDGIYELCWIYSDEWTLAHGHRLKRLKTVVDEGSIWLKNNLVKLLDCHWIGYSLGINKWREEWGGWGHGTLGIAEFKNETTVRGVPKNWELMPAKSSL